MDYWDPAKHILEQPEKGTKNIDAAEFDWKERMLKSFEPTKPAWADDKSVLDDLARDEKEKMYIFFPLSYLSLKNKMLI